MEKRLTQVLALIVFLFLGSCYPEGPEFVEDLDVVYTNYDPGFNFSEQNTFAIPDSIVLIRERNHVSNGIDNSPETVDPVYADVILEQIREQLIDYGWTEVDITENPDVTLLVSASRMTNLFYNYDWNYWDWWYPGGFNGYGMYYPGYSPGYITGYRSGSLMIQMANTSNLGVNNNVPVVWLGVINGLLEGSTKNINNRVMESIDQVFDQSPYLNQ